MLPANSHTGNHKTYTGYTFQTALLRKLTPNRILSNSSIPAIELLYQHRVLEVLSVNIGGTRVKLLTKYNVAAYSFARPVKGNNK